MTDLKGNEQPAGVDDEGEDDDDDYMNMTFDDSTTRTETSLQRTERLKRESLARGRVKSKAELASEEAAARDKALSTSLLETAAAKKSKGLAMMAKMGFSGGGLGRRQKDGQDSANDSGIMEPIKVNIKEDRGGIGLESERKRKFLEASGDQSFKAIKLDPDVYRERIRKEREDERLEKQVFAAQRVAERMDEEKGEGTRDPGSRPLKSIPVPYRGLVRHREQNERDRRMRHDLDQSLPRRLPTYDDEDEDDDDKRALGKARTLYVMAQDLDEEDDELDEFSALEPEKRLEKLVLYLRGRHWYCLWCKMQYESESMEGCPGITEEDHD